MRLDPFVLCFAKGAGPPPAPRGRSLTCLSCALGPAPSSRTLSRRSLSPRPRGTRGYWAGVLRNPVGLLRLMSVLSNLGWRPCDPLWALSVASVGWAGCGSTLPWKDGSFPFIRGKTICTGGGRARCGLLPVGLGVGVLWGGPGAPVPLHFEYWGDFGQKAPWPFLKSRNLPGSPASWRC